MRDHVLLYLNGERHAVRGRDTCRPLAEYLRGIGLTGTKVVCNEGDCGSCTVLVGRPERGRPLYRAIDSCIAFVFQVEGCHVVTVEGLDGPSPRTSCGPEALETLTPVQRSMVECHGSQCGFCTPGFVMMMTGLLEEHERLDADQLRHGLTGNLCRCTGYAPIFQAGEAIDLETHQRVSARFPQDQWTADVARHRHDRIEIVWRDELAERRLVSPQNLAAALQARQQYPQGRLVAGATDLGVQWNKGRLDPPVLIDLNRVTELQGVTVSGACLTAGARATWTELADAFAARVGAFAEILSVFGSPQIRNAGTLGGNIVNASPIADSLPFLMVCDAELEILGPAGERQVNINDFYTGYKQFDLADDELLVRVRIPLPAADDVLRLYKVSRRRDLDIATFTAAVRMRLDGEEIVEARVAFGAVGPTVIRASETESFLRGKVFSAETLTAAGEVAVGETAPISDVRGSAEYRTQLTRNTLVKFYHEVAAS